MASLVKTKKVVQPNGAVVRAIGITKHNFKKVAEWINRAGGEAEAIEHVGDEPNKNGTWNDRVKVKTKKGFRVARIGDLVLRGSANDVFGVIKNEDFFGEGWKNQ